MDGIGKQYFESGVPDLEIQILHVFLVFIVPNSTIFFVWGSVSLFYPQHPRLSLPHLVVSLECLTSEVCV